MSQEGKWVYDPLARKNVWVKTPAIVKAVRNQEQSLDQAINRAATQGMAFLVVAGILWFVRELAKSWEN